MVDHSTEDIFLRGKDGTLKDAITQAHVFVLSRASFRSMQNTLYDKFASGASRILYDMGEGYGSKIASLFIKKGLSFEQTMKELERIAYLAGWGNMHFRILDDGRAECIVENSMFSVKREGVPNSCYFLAGVLGGNMAALRNNHNFFAKEVQCSISGHSFCKFTIEEQAIKPH